MKVFRFFCSVRVFHFDTIVCRTANCYCRTAGKTPKAISTHALAVVASNTQTNENTTHVMLRCQPIPMARARTFSSSLLRDAFVEILTNTRTGIKRRTQFTDVLLRIAAASFALDVIRVHAIVD